MLFRKKILTILLYKITPFTSAFWCWDCKQQLPKQEGKISPAAPSQEHKTWATALLPWPKAVASREATWLSCPKQPEKEKTWAGKAPQQHMGYTGLTSPGQEQPKEQGTGSYTPAALQLCRRHTEVTVGGFGVVMVQLAVPCKQASWAHPKFFTCSLERGVRRQKGSGLEASVSEGPGGRLAKNLKNKQVCICFQVICARLKTIGASCEICKVQKKRFKKIRG